VVIKGDRHRLARAILVGARAGELPIISTEGRRIVVNTATTSKLGIEIPAAVLEQVDEVYGN
jgi:ABC-type uncharacterized transport system substrate-binding protein